MDPDVRAALERRDYAELARLLSGRPPESLGPLARTLRFARNMLALQRRDPELADEIENAPTTGAVRIITANDGRETLALSGHPENPLCPGGSPSAVVEQTEQRLAEIPDPSRSIALAGVGCGAALTRLADEKPDIVGRERVVYVVEPNTEIFRSAMMLHDWSAGEGPLARGRFVLCVGSAWKERLASTLTPDSRLPPPEKAIRLCPDPTATRDEMRRVAAAIGDTIRARRASLASVYAPRTPADIAARLRRPGVRVMLLTTRYSTVLQHSTRHFAEGFDRAGAETRIVIEQHPWEQHLIASLLGEVERFTPDLVIQIDHHRHETPDVIPPQVPFVCIIQDNLPNLLSRDAAAKMGPTDFAAGSWVRRYVLEHAYPASRSIEIPRLTRTPAAPAVHTGGGVDLLYVSNHSATPDRALELAAASVDDANTEGQKFVRACARALIEHYDSGAIIEDSLDLDTFVEQICSVRGLRTPSLDTLRAIADILGTTVNNALYRQQGLRWAADVAGQLGLTLRIHGKGWEENPEFAPHAAGPLDYADLPAETSRARFCLVLEPYFPTQHQRALDTWVWGGLPLIRRRARDDRQQAFNAWLAEIPPEIDTLEAALEHLGDRADDFRRVHDAQVGLHAWDGPGDQLALARERQRRGIGYLNELPPRYDETSFRDRDALADIVRTLIDDPALYEQIRLTQHDWARPRFSYELGAKRLLEQVAANMPGA